MKKYIQLLAVTVFVITNWSCSPSSKDMTIPASLKPLMDDDDDNVQFFDPQVDILFVIDNSGSMWSHQSNLSTNAQTFVQNFQKNGGLDYHLGIITTDTDSGPGCCGELYGTPKYIDRKTPNGMDLFAKNLMVGTNGSFQEKVFDPLSLAISPELMNGENKGFIRREAYLVVIFVTDAEDQSLLTNDSILLDKLVALKSGQYDKILAYGAIVPSTDISCPRDGSESPFKIETFLANVSNGKSNNNILNLCDPNFGQKLADIAKDLAGRIGNTILLNRRPKLDTVVVRFGTQIIPPGVTKGWSYNIEKNAIILASDIQWSRQPEGTRIKVSFESYE